MVIKPCLGSGGSVIESLDWIGKPLRWNTQHGIQWEMMGALQNPNGAAGKCTIVLPKHSKSPKTMSTHCMFYSGHWSHHFHSRFVCTLLFWKREKLLFQLLEPQQSLLSSALRFNVQLGFRLFCSVWPRPVGEIWQTAQVLIGQGP